jgi:hypothetical protein
VFPATLRWIHWGRVDPPAATGDEKQRRAAFRRIRDELPGLVRGAVGA